ncbi:hypothetical protein B0F90DRAFT_612348 [Multifurca ochricompacta]|uniref:Secreted protein n=1 Tax=Multifurca ochricompacta TaxID=376703 RepID=A0AAD4M232_9AGAM|nr:hypothetical protein B0F90DRAFT_612348 [Multifurca ochricompacta]
MKPKNLLLASCWMYSISLVAQTKCIVSMPSGVMLHREKEGGGGGGYTYSPDVVHLMIMTTTQRGFPLPPPRASLCVLSRNDINEGEGVWRERGDTHTHVVPAATTITNKRYTHNGGDTRVNINSTARTGYNWFKSGKWTTQAGMRPDVALPQSSSPTTPPPPPQQQQQHITEQGLGGGLVVAHIRLSSRVCVCKLYSHSFIIARPRGFIMLLLNNKHALTSHSIGRRLFFERISGPSSSVS